MDKEDEVYTHNGILLGHKNKWNNTIFSNMDTIGDYHMEGSKLERERQILYESLTCGI